MPIIAKGPIANGHPNSNPYPNPVLTLGNTRKLSIAGKPRDAAVNRIVELSCLWGPLAMVAPSYGGASLFYIVGLSLQLYRFTEIVADIGNKTDSH